MKTLVYSIFFLLVLRETDAQNPIVVDSLQRLLTQTIGADRYPPLYELAFEYVDKDNEKALAIIEEARNAALLSGDSLWIVKSMRVKAQMLSRLERLGESITLGEEARRIAFNNGYSSEQAMIANSLAGPYSFCLRYDKALEYFFEALQLAEVAGDSSLFAAALHNIGVVYLRLDNYKTSLDYFLKAQEISQAINQVKPFELRNMSIAYANLGHLDSAEYYLTQSIKECSTSCSEIETMYMNFCAGVIFYCKKNYGSAILQFSNVYSIARKLKNTRAQLDIIFLLTQLYLDKNQIYKARELLLDGERLITKGSDLNLEKLRIFRMLARMHLANKNFEACAVYQNKYIILKDSLYHNGLTTRLMEIESEFKERENREVMAKQSQMIKLKEGIIIRQGHLNAVIVLLALITMAFLIYVFQNYQKKRRANLLLDQLVTERTIELEMNRNSLLNKLTEKDLVIDRVSAGVKEQIATLYALRSTAISEVADSLALQYIERYDLALSKIERYLLLLSTTTKSDGNIRGRSTVSVE